MKSVILGRVKIFKSFRFRLLAGTFGVFLILMFSAAYILFSSKQLQTIQDKIYEQERYIAGIRDDLDSCREPLLEYLSTRSSNALARLLINSQNLRNRLPAYFAIRPDELSTRERELYYLIYSYLNLADEAVEEKRGRNIGAYTGLYDEMEDLLVYIHNEIETISVESFRARMDVYRVFLDESQAIYTWNLLFIVFTSIFAILLLLVSAQRITFPLERLAVMAAELSAGHFDIEDIATNSVDEIDKAVDAFNRMKGEIRNYIGELKRQENIKQEYMNEKMRNLKMEALVRRVEIYALQAQMNPHFLFNTLNTGMQLAIVESADRTAEYMEYMAQLFRHIIRNKEIFVPLRHEIESLDYYFKILKVRFPRNLDLVLDYNEALLDSCKTPVSILQPLVENCIVHAFKAEKNESREQRNFINVRAEKQGSRLTIQVLDNGCGMDAEKAKRLLNPHSIDDSSISRVMGLENVIQRLYFFYPDDPEVVGIETKEGGGTRVFIRIDLERPPCTGF
jgi:sensor histidine kinase YesM